ncbi:TetR family transcriptional regulator C-terminal domain-containing protein [Streptomyces sp. NPDC085596]|uniref:TetR family transcriptional regulator C-terminal domain-containing protein n=1 Tax=Streptomyces sp. NPDC085596 TaxID=3365731 RepID=UPI0037D63032
MIRRTTAAPRSASRPTTVTCAPRAARWRAELRFLTGTAEAATLPGRPAGCLTVQGGLACGAEDSEIVELLATSRARTRQALHDRLTQAVTDGDLPPATDCAALSRCVVATAEGLNVEASAGATYPGLAAAAEVGARVIPAAGPWSSRRCRLKARRGSRAGAPPRAGGG